MVVVEVAVAGVQPLQEDRAAAEPRSRTAPDRAVQPEFTEMMEARLVVAQLLVAVERVVVLERNRQTWLTVG
jgi:hypothetical protein